MLALLKLVLLVVFVFSAVAAFHKWLDYIEQRRVVVTWARFFIWLWSLATAAWIGPMLFLGLVHGDFFRAPLSSLRTIAVYGLVPSLLALMLGIVVARTRRSFRQNGRAPRLNRRATESSRG
jgi:heme/copper-type cytochrome/quinol oxidase subunit 1